MNKRLLNYALTLMLFLTACGVSPDLPDTTANASLGADPVLNGSIENWQTGKTGLLKFRFVKKNLNGPALFDATNTFGEFTVSPNGGFRALLPTAAELESLLETASTTLSSVPCYGSSIQITPSNVKMALAFMDLYWDNITPTNTFLVAANNNAMQHFDLKKVPVGTKLSAYAYVDRNASVNAACGLLIAGSYRLNLKLKQGWNLLTLEIESRGLFDYTNLRLSTNGIPEGLKWFTFGQSSNTPNPPIPLESPTPFPPAPIVPRANR
jgi:hypothetical protein